MTNSEPMTDRMRHFFYDLEVPYGLAICRICLPLALMGMLLPRWLVCRELFSTDGATGQLSMGFANYNMLPEFSGTVVAALYAVMLFALFSASAGWCTRAACLIACTLFTYFCMLDCVSTMTKFTAMATHMLLILGVSPCGEIWSVDAWLANRKRNLDPTQPRFSYPKFSAWPRRLMQLHIGFVYFGAGITKIHTPSFFSGDQLQYWMLTHLNYKHPLGELLSNYQILLVAMGYITVIWELAFLLSAWKSAWRFIVLPIGVLFHFMTTLTLGLIIFPMVCYCCYFAFLDEDDMQRSCAWMRRQSRHFDLLKTLRTKLIDWQTAIGNRPQWSNRAKVGFAITLPLVAFLGIQIEYQYDVYNQRGPEGRPQLVALDPERARLLLAPVAPQRDIDKFFAVDMGTFLIADIVANRRSTFRQGEKVIVQCSLIPPHEDMNIESKIRDVDNQIVERMSTIATREVFRANMNFKIREDLPPGEYSMSIETAGRHVLNKKFTVLPKYGSVASR